MIFESIAVFVGLPEIVLLTIFLMTGLLGFVAFVIFKGNK